jgi:hypothetical protein
MTSSFRARACKRSAGTSRRRWLALLLLALLGDLSSSAATHRHPAPGDASAGLEQGSGPGSRAPGPQGGGVSLDDVCALCGALAASASACTSRMPLDLEAQRARSLGPLPDLILSAAAGWWSSTASRAPPALLF